MQVTVTYGARSYWSILKYRILSSHFSIILGAAGSACCKVSFTVGIFVIRQILLLQSMSQVGQFYTVLHCNWSVSITSLIPLRRFRWCDLFHLVDSMGNSVVKDKFPARFYDALGIVLLLIGWRSCLFRDIQWLSVLGV